MNTWESRIVDCIEDESQRCYLKGIPVVLISAVEYLPDGWYWVDFIRGNSN